MSYILDALKKSDMQRKQGDVPSLQTVHLPVRPQGKTPRVLYGVIALLLLMLMFVLGYLFSQQFLQSQKDASSVALPTAGDKSVEPLAASQSDKADSHKTERIETDGEADRAAVIQYQSSASDTDSSVETVRTQRSTEKSTTVMTVPPASRMTQPELMDIAYLNELADYQQQSIPVMEFAGHVYSSEASSRSVIINGQFMEEGDSLLPGLRIERITINGVVFAHQDSLFRVDILQDWSFE